MNTNWEYVPFDNLFEWKQKSHIKSGEGKDTGAYKLFVCSDTEIKRFDEYIESGESLVFGTGGKATCHFANERFAYSTDCIVAQKKAPNVCTKFYYYYLRKNRLNAIQQTFSGVGLQHTSKKKIGVLSVPIPTLREQEYIVARIEELFSELDNGVETLRKTKQQLAVYRQAVLVDAFKGDYPKVPLKTISQAMSGYAFKSKRYTADGQYTVVKIGNVKPFHFDFSRDLTKTNEIEGNILGKYLLKTGDCLITLTGSRGKRDYGFVAMVTNQENYLLNQRVAALRFNADVALPEFYLYYLSSSEYRNQFFAYETGNVGQGNVGIKALIEPIVVCPSVQKQKEIVAEVEARLSTCDSIEKTVDTALQQAEAMRQSILKQAFEGSL